MSCGGDYGALDLGRDPIMIRFRKDEDRDYRWLNRTIAPYMNQLIRDDQTLTLAQEAAMKQMLRDIISGYKHTISRLEWGD